MEKNMNTERKRELYDFAMRNAEESIKKADEQQKIFDSTALKFSAGAFALSFSVINTFIPLSGARSKAVLLCAWLAFTLSIMAGLLSCIVAVEKHTYDYRYEIERYEAVSNGRNEPEYKKRYFRFCDFLNKSTFIFFTVGIICLLLFVFKNI